jgi:hypothetical protein
MSTSTSMSTTMFPFSLSGSFAMAHAPHCTPSTVRATCYVQPRAHGTLSPRKDLGLCVQASASYAAVMAALPSPGKLPLGPDGKQHVNAEVPCTAEGIGGSDEQQG